MYAVIVDVRDEAAALCSKYGFIPFADPERRLLLPMATLRRLVDD